MLNEKELIKVSNKRIIKMKKEEKVNANVKRKNMKGEGHKKILNKNNKKRKIIAKRDLYKYSIKNIFYCLIILHKYLRYQLKIKQLFQCTLYIYPYFLW